MSYIPTSRALSQVHGIPGCGRCGSLSGCRDLSQRPARFFHQPHDHVGEAGVGLPPAVGMIVRIIGTESLWSSSHRGEPSSGNTGGGYDG